MSAAPNIVPRLEFLSGGGETGALIRAHDWDATPLGAPETWPQALRSAVQICLNTPIVSAVHWGPDLRLLYNDAYAPALAERHPWALGRPLSEVWAEIWDVLGPQIASVMETGRGFSTGHQPLKMNRNGRVEDTYWIYSFAPLHGGSTVAGVLLTAFETTDKVLADRQLTEVEERQRQMLRQMPGFVGMLSGPDLVYTYVNDAYVAISERTDFVGRRFRDVFADIEGQGYFEAFENAFRTGTPVVTRGMELRLHGRADPQYVDFVLEPIRDDAGAVTGLFVGGYETTEIHRGNEALRQSEERQRFLLELGDRIRGLSDPEAVVAESSRALGEQLGATRVAYAEIDAPESRGLIHGQWTSGDAPRLPAEIRLGEFGAPLLDRLRAGGTLAIEDVRLDPCTRDHLAALDAIDAWALVSVPLFKNGGFAVNLNVHQDRPRAWTHAEVTLIEAVAERTWEAVERAGAEQRSRDVEERYLALFNAIDQGFCTIDVAFDQQDKPIDYRFVEVSPSFERQTGIENGAGRWMREIAADQDQFWFDTYGRVALTGEPARFQSYSTPLDRWWDVYAFRISGERRVAVLFRDITDQKRAEAALRENEARLAFLDRLSTATAALTDADVALATTTRLLGEHLNLSVCAYADMDQDEDGFTIRGDWAAPGAESIVGHYSLADFGKLAVKNLSAGLPLVVNDNLAELAPEEAATFQNIGIAATICMPLVKDGRLSALMAIHDRVPRVWTDAELSLLREVTARSWAHVERVAAAAELRESEARFRLMADAVPQIVWITDADGRTEFFNKQWSDYTGAPYEPTTATEVAANHVHLEDASATITAFDEARRTGSTFQVEHRIRSAAGDYRWFLVRGEPYRDRQTGEVVRWFGASTDIHDRKIAEARLRDLNATLEERVAERTAERNMLATLVETTDVMIMAADFDHNILATNAANADEFERIYGVRPAAGDNILELLAGRPEEQDQVRAGWGRAFSGDQITFVEDFGDPDRARPYYEIKFRPLRNEDGERIGAYQFVTDVTDRLRREAQLAEAQEALRQSQKMEAIGQLTGGVAHDFNNLLTPIVGSLDMLQRKGIGGEREQRLIAGAAQSAERAKTLVQRLLAFSRRQPLQPVPVDVAKLVAGMADLVSSTTGPQINVVVDAAEGLPSAKADPNQLEMALLNLSVNARDAMPNGGTLRITARAEKVGPAHGSGLKPGRYVKLSVADTGVGMDEATLARAIEPFFSTKGLGKGTGLGLSMVHGLASQLGGTLTIRSQPGLGTNIELWLPVINAPAESAGAVAQASEPVMAAGTALLVDDEELVRLSTADMLSDLGYSVVEADSAEKALQLIRGGLRPDLLVTDHLMPGMNGTDLARIVRSERPDASILLVSGYAEAEGVAPDLPRLTKPFRNDELAASLAQLRASA